MFELLTIGEVARRSGVAASAPRYYDGRGLIASERSGSGHRRYQRPVLRRIAFIVFAQQVGLTLEEIGNELDKLPGNRVPSRRDWSRLSGTWTGRIDDRIAELERLKLGLTECIGCGCLSLDRCKARQRRGLRRAARLRTAVLAGKPLRSSVMTTRRIALAPGTATPPPQMRCDGRIVTGVSARIERA